MLNHPSRLGPFAIEELLGPSDRNQTYRAVHVQKRVSVALRLLDKNSVPAANRNEFPDLFLNLKQLVHPGVARCLGGSAEGDWAYVVYKFVNGEALSERLDRLSKLPWEAAVDIIQHVCQGLAHAHKQGLFHGRLSDEKVVVDESGAAVVVGFASAIIERYGKPPSHDSGQSPYLAPEQLSGDGSSAQADIYALGVMLFRMITGRFPPVTNQTTSGSNPDLQITSYEMNSPIWLDVLVERMLAPLAKDRPASAVEVFESLQEMQRNLASGVGMAQRALSKKPSALARSEGNEELNRIRKKRTRKKTKDLSPFYTKAWFLAICIGLIIGGAAWTLWPMSETELYDRGAKMMATNDPGEWYKAKDLYLAPYLERFPDGTHNKEVQGFLDKITVELTFKKMLSNRKFGKQPNSEAERMCLGAYAYEEFGDAEKAMQGYQSVAAFFETKTDEKSLAFVLLSNHRKNELKNTHKETTPEQFLESRKKLIEDQLEKARMSKAASSIATAKSQAEKVLRLYSSDQEVVELVAVAKAILDGPGTP